MQTNHRPLLAWDRAEFNRRKTRLLLVAFVLMLLPVAASLLPYFAEVILFAVAIVALTVLYALGLIESGIREPSEATLIAVFGLSMVLTVLGVIGLVAWRVRSASRSLLRKAGARPVDAAEEPDLTRRTGNLCIGAGLPVPALHVVESDAVNAFSAGLRPEASALAVTRGMLRLLTPVELEAVLAHELSKIGNYDVRLNTVLAAILPLARLPVSVGLGFFRFLFRLHPVVGFGALLYLGIPVLLSVPGGIAMSVAMLQEEDKLAGFALLTLTLGQTYVIFGSPIISLLLSRAVSREAVFRADADAVLLTRNPDALATALLKIDAAHTPVGSPNASLAHAYFVRPLSDDAPWWDRTFAPHPTERERVAVLGQLGMGLPLEEAESAVSAGERYAARAKAGNVGSMAPLPATSTSTPDAPPSPTGRVLGYRLMSPAPLLSGPSLGAAQIRTLSRGELVVPQETEGDFLRVLCADDRSGYVARFTAMEEVHAAG